MCHAASASSLETAVDGLLFSALERLIKTGNLRVTTSSGSTRTFGDGTGIPVSVRFATPAAQRTVLLDPELKLGEAYVEGGLIIERGSILDLLALAMSQNPERSTPFWMRALQASRYVGRRVAQFNHRSRSERNVARHYDLD